MDDFDAKLQAFVAKVTADLATYYTANFPSLAPSIADPRWGQKYVKVDVVNDGGKGQRSGRYMVDVLTGEIFGIKAYGVIHRGHEYGTLDTINDYYWGNYYPSQPGKTPGESLVHPSGERLAEAVRGLRAVVCEEGSEVRFRGSIYVDVWVSPEGDDSNPRDLEAMRKEVQEQLENVASELSDKFGAAYVGGIAKVNMKAFPNILDKEI